MREIILDTETTGLDALGGHRIVEIGAVELVEHWPTGRTFYRYLNSERDHGRAPGQSLPNRFVIPIEQHLRVV
jgi:DNA polymerase III epsilon subunit-like protein